MQIGDKIKISIVDINHDGFGVGRLDGFAIFVANTLYNEVVTCKISKINKNFAYADLIEINEPSLDRVKPVCGIFEKCGGCHLQHLEYSKQLEYKVNVATSTFKRIGHLDLTVDEIIGMENPYNYRNKIQVPFGTKKNKTICGYYKRKSHDIIPFDNCYIQPEYDNDIINFIKNLANEYNILGYDEVKHTGIIRHVILRTNYKNEVMVVIVANSTKLPHQKEITQKLTSRYPQIVSVILNINLRKTNVILGSDSVLLFGSETIIDRIGNLDFKISHYSFFQINPEQTVKLYDKVIEYLNPSKNDVVMDGYCGVGTISLYIANKVKWVYGVEVIEEAIADAINNADLNNITNASFEIGKVEDKIEEYVNKGLDAIVIDPPRKGVDKNVLDIIVASKIKKIVYVSCDVATLARDLEILNSEYTIDKITLVDMFPQTTGIESVVLLNRR